MIKHIVMWRIAAGADGADGGKAANANEVKRRLEALQGRIPGLLRIEVGINFVADEQAADVVLVSEFTSREALEAYQVHPAHNEAAEFVKAVRSERRVVDYEI